MHHQNKNNNNKKIINKVKKKKKLSLSNLVIEKVEMVSFHTLECLIEGDCNKRINGRGRIEKPLKLNKQRLEKTGVVGKFLKIRVGVGEI